MTRNEPLKSERVVVAAPMSFAGAFGRIRRLYGDLTRRLAGPKWLAVRVLIGLALVCVLVVWWAAVVAWYLLWGILLIPYRLIRRGTRKRKITARQHRELLSALERQNEPPRGF
jgi:hypothetical protein